MDNNLKIINYLGKQKGECFTMHQLSTIINVPYATFYRTIQKMRDLLVMQQIGHSKTISLNVSNPVIKSYLAVSSEEEKKEFLKNQPIISKISSELNGREVVLLFGSYAKGTEKESSDIDLLIINKKGDKSIPFFRYETLFRKKINPIFVTRAEFEAMLDAKEENVGKQALKEHVILQNSEGFWECVLNG